MTRAPVGRQGLRRLAQASFFLLFCLAPVFNLLRYDLDAGHAWLLTMEWRAGLEPFLRGEIGAWHAAWAITWRVFAPILGAGALLLWVAWRWGRLYCGWLCPHFSAVETINHLMRMASGKFSVWDARPAPPRRPDGARVRYDRHWWLAAVPSAIGLAFVWAVVLLTYLLPPDEVYGNLLSGELTPNQFRFIVAATAALSVEFLFARHLFCRYGCAMGLFQSLAWMGNRNALVVGFERRRAAECATCYSACDHACPMRLKPRSIKRLMFTCTQCAQCVTACEQTQAGNPNGPLLNWIAGEAAGRREAGFRPAVEGAARTSPSMTSASLRTR